ncbi:unnamed protein product [Heligmosomoides polygyrus]|uniref:Uncharacterized protein n=1 Tax=Heligmosomoides polygyrus TaxID=6339 RepID=A0A3P7TDL6_HELPZ|nr:unnamed protein product [Heligmosomoides polygyrus]
MYNEYRRRTSLEMFSNKPFPYSDAYDSNRNNWGSVRGTASWGWSGSDVNVRGPGGRAEKEL